MPSQYRCKKCAAYRTDLAGGMCAACWRSLAGFHARASKRHAAEGRAKMCEVGRIKKLLSAARKTKVQ